VARPFGTARRRPGDVDENDRQATFAKRAQQCTRANHDPVNGMNEWEADNALLQINDDKGCLRVERGEGHVDS